MEREEKGNLKIFKKELKIKKQKQEGGVQLSASLVVKQVFESTAQGKGSLEKGYSRKGEQLEQNKKPIIHISLSF